MSKDIQDIIDKAIALKETNLDASKSLIITAKALFPKNFEIHFMDYQLHKTSRNCQDAAQSFSYIVLYFENPEIMQEIHALINSLKKADRSENLDEFDSFYVGMFQYFAVPIGQKIVMMLTADDSTDFAYIRIMKKFSRNFNLALHLPRLLDKILNGIPSTHLTEMLVKEVLPLMMSESHLDIPNNILINLLALIFKYYISNLFNHGDKKHLAEESRVKLMEFFTWIGSQLKWEPFHFNSSWTKDIFWQKLKQIENIRGDSKQIFYLACYLFFISAQDYLESSIIKTEDGHEVQYILIDGMSESESSPPLMNILHEPPFPAETLTSFLTAFKSQELLQRNVMFYQDFNKILFELNVTRHINRVVIDFAIYLRSSTDCYNLIAASKTSSLEQSIRMLSIGLNGVNSLRETFDYIRAIITDLPNVNGHFLKNFTADRSLLFLPLTRNAIVQYCTRVIISCLKKKAFKENPSTKLSLDDFQLGSLLVLLQLEFYENIPMIEHIFEIIRVKGLDFPLFSNYIINIDLIEEFMSIHRGGEVKLKLSSANSSLTPTSQQRRIGTRGADRNVKEDFKQIIRQQVLRSNENVVDLIISFIEQEHMNLLTNLMAF